MNELRRKLPPIGIVAAAFFLRVYRLTAVPFGWHPDEATKALLARDVLAGAYFPAFFSAFTGREALFVYLEAAFFLLMGESLFIGRLLSAFIGTLTVALTYAAFRQLFTRRIALFTAVFLAVSLWHLIASRNGYRAVVQPLIQLPVIWLLFKGWQRGGIRYFAAAGLFLGLTQYTYTAVRIFPFLIVAIVLMGLLAAPRIIWRSRWGLAMTAVIALIVFLPLGWHFYQNPLDFYGRAAQISIFSAEWSGGDTQARLWQSVKETARMFTSWGDINYRFNIAGLPVFGKLDRWLFLFGLPLSIFYAVRKQGLARLAYLTMPVWLLIMLVPMFLSAESLPYYQRAIGALPAVYFFPALTVDSIITAVYRRQRNSSTIFALFIGVFFVYLGLRTADDYFIRWHLAPENDDHRRAAMVYVADYLNEMGSGNTLYLSTQYMQHPTLALLAPQRYDEVVWFNAQQALPLPPPGQEADYLLLLENAPQAALLERAGLTRVETAVDRFDRPVFERYHWDGGAYPQPPSQSLPFWSWETAFPPQNAEARHSIDLPVNFGGAMALLGTDGNTAVLHPGETMKLILYWELLGKPSRPQTIFAHLLNADGQVVAGYDANEYPTPFWREDGGERLLSYFPLTAPPDLPSGVYQLEIGVYNQESGERLQIFDGETAVADRLLLTPVQIDN